MVIGSRKNVSEAEGNVLLFCRANSNSQQNGLALPSLGPHGTDEVEEPGGIGFEEEDLVMMRMSMT